MSEVMELDRSDFNKVLGLPIELVVIKFLLRRRNFVEIKKTRWRPQVKEEITPISRSDSKGKELI